MQDKKMPAPQSARRRDGKGFWGALISVAINKPQSKPSTVSKSKASYNGRRLQSGNVINIDMIDRMNGVGFEKFLKELFNRMGYSVSLTKTSGDQGVDLILVKSGERVAVQAKRYQGSVGNSSVQQVYAGKTFYRCNAALVVTNSYFTDSAKTLAGQNNVGLIDRDVLCRYLKRYF